MFTFLRKLFQKKEEIVQKKLTLQELEEWLISKEQEKEESFKSRLKEFEQEFLEVKDGLEKQMEILQKATLQNTSIPPKAFHYMEGNRESYMRFMRQFLLTVSNTPKSQKDVENYCRQFIHHLNHFARVSQRNYFVLQNFFANTLKDIGQLLKALEEHIKRLGADFEHLKIKEVINIKKNLEEFRQKRSYKDLLKQDIHDAETTVQSSIAHVEKANNQLISIEKEEQWRQLKEWETTLVKTVELSKEEEQSVGLLFSPLEKALRKFSKEAFDNQKLIERYGETPAQVLEEDKQLHILSILEKLKVNLEKNGLGLDEKRIQKAITAVGSLTREVLTQHQTKLIELKQQVNRIQENIASSTIQQEHENQKKALEIAKEESERKKQALESLKMKFNDIDVQKLLSDLENSANQKLGEHISIVMEKVE